MKGNDKKEYKNWYKTLLRIQKKELILFVVLILLALIFVGISSDICKWLKTEVIYDIVNNKCLKTEVIHDIVNNKLLINIPICIIISGFAIWWWCKILKDKDIRPYRLGLIISLFIITYYSKVKYANITENISYEHFFRGLLVISAIIIITKFIIYNFFTRSIILKFISKHKCLLNCYLSKNRFKRSRKIVKLRQKELELKGFSVDDTEIKLEDTQKEYAKTLVKKLKNTDLSKESFAVGITGEWGSGKSTFLNTMKKEIEEEDFAEIVEFNPWLCNSPEQVTQDFFATLIDKLSPKHSTLSRDINKYAKLLNKMAKASLSFFGIDLDLTPSDDSLNKLKENISNKLANLPKKVVILIDDTDRLEGNEIFEILRLIRNTADFKNVIYIATYDKEYVTDVLKDNKINDPDNYLEKIFQVEVHLLKVEVSELWDTLMKEIKKQLNSINSISTTILNTYIKPHKEFIMRVLTNYRQVKRFAKQFAVYLDYLNSINLINELSPIDLFWIELLQTYDKRVYNILAKDPLKILKVYGIIFNVNEEIIKGEDDTKEKSKWKEKTERILNIIFVEEYKEQNILLNGNDFDSKRLRLLDNYFKYFTLSVSPDKISFKEMSEMLDSDAPEAIVDNWIKNNKNYNSILCQFFNNKINSNSDKYLRNHIFGLLYFASYSNYPDISDIRYLLQRGRYNDVVDKASEIANTWFENKINNLDDTTELQRLSALLNKIHEGPGEGDYEMIISYEEIEEHLKTIITKVLNSNKSYSALGILQPRFELNVIFKNCCVQFFIENEDDYYEQIALDIVIKHFSKKENKPTLEEFDKVYKENYDYDNMTDDETNKIDTELTKLFGSNYKKNKERFKKECFIQN
jgi:energy-coupling factor transporter ATP-binding protein EcfA2